MKQEFSIEERKEIRRSLKSLSDLASRARRKGALIEYLTTKKTDMKKQFSKHGPGDEDDDQVDEGEGQE